MKFMNILPISILLSLSVPGMAYEKAIDGSSLIATSEDPAVPGYCRLGFPDSYGDYLATIAPYEHWINPPKEFVKFFVVLPDAPQYYRWFSNDIAVECKFGGKYEGMGAYIIDTIKYRSEKEIDSPHIGKYQDYSVDLTVKGVDAVFTNMSILVAPASKSLLQNAPLTVQYILKSKESGRAVRVKYAYDHN